MIGPGRDRPFRSIAHPAVRAATTPSRCRCRPAAALITNEDAQRMPMDARIASLEERHAALERQILDEDRRPRPDDTELLRLKREKLRLKEEMERLRISKPH